VSGRERGVVFLGALAAVGTAATCVVRCCSSRELQVPSTPPAASSPSAEGAAASSAARPAPRELQLASWNLEWLSSKNDRGPVRRRDADYARLAGYAMRLDADVVAVQEVDGEGALRRVFDPGRYAYHLATQHDAQLTGFAYRRDLAVLVHPDLEALNVGGVRVGVDVTVHVNGQPLRLLSVHLKSACFSGSLGRAKAACVKLRAQLPVLEAWIDARAAAHEPFVVLGDFNRRLNADDPFYRELDDGDPPEADLTLVTEGQPSHCWGGKFPDFIDHMLLSKSVASWQRPGSFSQLEYTTADTVHHGTLSDHCPISIVLAPRAASAEAPPPAEPAPVASASVASPAPAPGGEPPAPALPAPGPIKGNINSRHQKLYHAPGCPAYANTRIEPSHGERLFATEAEAVAAGWQKAPGCP
jgi:endonuclease/exonuclease/phosphatase family metal-dependent hydrolase